MSEKPLWRQVIDGVDNVIGPRLTEFTKTDEFKDGLSTIGNLSAGLKSRLERRSRQWLHMWNLPAGSDVSQLKRQIASLDHEVRRLRAELGKGGPAAADDNVRPVRPRQARSTRQARPAARGANNG